MTFEEIKLLILWCKENKVKSFTNNEISFELSDLAFIDAIAGGLDQINTKEEFLDSQKILIDTEEMNEQELDDLLYWSTKKSSY